MAVTLHAMDAEVVDFEPEAMANAWLAHPELLYCNSALDAATGAVVVLFTE